MASIAQENSDFVILTSDNPRTEDPRAIIDQILPGIPHPFLVEVDRQTAIRAAVAEALSLKEEDAETEHKLTMKLVQLVRAGGRKEEQEEQGQEEEVSLPAYSG